MAVDEQDNPSESTPREAELQRQLGGLQSQMNIRSSWSKVLRSLLCSNLKTLFSETRIKPSTRQATRSAASAHRSDPCRAWTHPTLHEVPLDSLQVKPGHQEKKLEVRESMKQHPATPSQTPRRKHPKDRGIAVLIDHLSGADVLQEARRHAIYGRKAPRGGTSDSEKDVGVYLARYLTLPELINALRQMGQQVKWPPKMRAPDSFRNPDLWCEFHRDHGHKTEDCMALKIEVNDLLQKGYLREFLSEKARNLLSKETPMKSAETKPASPPRQDRVIYVISGGSEISGISHAAPKKSTRNAKLGLETSKSK
ncbi:hypothetical protein F2Q68_00010851 [Brassica cretica]|nr:hypothetical protein F2Q68_00010851 [Brassica cretica]